MVQISISFNIELLLLCDDFLIEDLFKIYIFSLILFISYFNLLIFNVNKTCFCSSSNRQQNLKRILFNLKIKRKKFLL